MILHTHAGPDMDFTQVALPVKEFILKGRDLRRSNFQGVELTGLDFSHSNLSEVNFSSALLGKANLSHIKSISANFEQALLNSAKFIDSTCENCNFSQANLNKVRFNNSKLNGADFSGANLANASFVGANLSHTYWSNASLEEANLSDTRFDDTSLSGVNLRRARLCGADLSQAELYGADLTDALYDEKTLFPFDFLPSDHGMKLASPNVKTSASTSSPENKLPVPLPKSPTRPANKSRTGAQTVSLPLLDTSSYPPEMDSRLPLYPPPTPVAPPRRPPNWPRYMHEVGARLAGWNPPPSSSNAYVITSMTIGRDGTLLSSSIKQSSGNTGIDQAAMGAVHAAAPYPPLPAEYEGNSQTIEYRFDILAAARQPAKRQR